MLTAATCVCYIKVRPPPGSGSGSGSGSVGGRDGDVPGGDGSNGGVGLCYNSQC
jgi:hypothetical protein